MLHRPPHLFCFNTLLPPYLKNRGLEMKIWTHSHLLVFLCWLSLSHWGSPESGRGLS